MRRYPPGVPCWVETAQPDPERAAAFYAGLFGWDVDDGVARLGGDDVAGICAAGAALAEWVTYVRVESAADSAATAAAAGGHASGGLFEVAGGGRGAALSDPAGGAFRVWEAGSHEGAQRVNAPGTWNWSNLETTDREGAQAFYGAVFGWEAMEVGPGFWMWRLPGYGDFLAERDPELRERHAQPGIPAGFSDAVGWLVPLLDEAAGPRWTVTFAVDDVDATAARANELGATVPVPPFDAGDARIAVLRDPQGAELTVSRYGA